MLLTSLVNQNVTLKDDYSEDPKKDSTRKLQSTAIKNKEMISDPWLKKNLKLSLYKSGLLSPDKKAMTHGAYALNNGSEYELDDYNPSNKNAYLRGGNNRNKGTKPMDWY